jgi:hypothetical protein
MSNSVTSTSSEGRAGRKPVPPLSYRTAMTWATAVGFLFIGGKLSALEEPVLSYGIIVLVFLQLSTLIPGGASQRISIGIQRAAKRTGGIVTWDAVRASVPEMMSDVALRQALQEREVIGALLRHYDADGLEWWSLPRMTDADDQRSTAVNDYDCSSYRCLPQ